MVLPAPRRSEKRRLQEDPTSQQVGAVAYSPETRSESRRSFLRVSLSRWRLNSTNSTITHRTEEVAASNNEFYNDEERKTEQQSQQRRVIYSVAFCLVTIAVAVGISVGVSRAGSSKNPQQSTSPSNTEGVDKLVISIEDILPAYTTQALRDPTSPQSAAWNWLKEDKTYAKEDSTKILTRFALATLYFSTNGDNWSVATSWLSHEVDECDWYTTTFFGPCGYLDLHFNGLDGEIPPEVALLTSLSGVSLAGNKLSGRIPTQLGLLTKLQYLDLQNNALTGEIPKQLGQLSRAVNLTLRNNNLTGSIPTEISEAKRVVYLDFSSNHFAGNIPTELGQLTRMEVMNLSKNKLTGHIPTELGLLIYAIANVDISHNKLSGQIPTELGLLASNSTPLYTGDFPSNPSFETLPKEYHVATTMQYLNISFNNFTSTLPSEIFLLRDLISFQTQSNSLTGRMPTEVGGLSQIVLLDISDNKIDGPIPSEIGLLRTIESLYLFNNHLNGTIPSELGALDKLEAFDLQFNPLLSGSIPKEVCGLFDFGSHSVLHIDCSTVDCDCGPGA